MHPRSQPGDLVVPADWRSALTAAVHIPPAPHSKPFLSRISASVCPHGAAPAPGRTSTPKSIRCWPRCRYRRLHLRLHFVRPSGVGWGGAATGKGRLGWLGLSSWTNKTHFQAGQRAHLGAIQTGQVRLHDAVPGDARGEGWWAWICANERAAGAYPGGPKAHLRGRQGGGVGGSGCELLKGFQTGQRAHLRGVAGKRGLRCLERGSE